MNDSKARERVVVNRALMSAGLGALDDPGLVPQIGFLVAKVVTDHDLFRTLINRCEPAERPHMYEALKPYMRFELKPLDVYIAESHAIAEAKQLPTLDAAGNLVPFRDAPEIKTGDLGTAQRVIDDSFVRYALTVVCKGCTREETFHGLRKEDAVRGLRAAGWRAHPADDSEICPKCAELRPSI